MAEINDGAVLAESIGVTTGGYLGGADTLNSLEVVVYPAEQRAIVRVDLRDASLDSQLRVIAAFAEVREVFADEVELDLRFGEPTPSASRASAKTAVLTY